MLERVLIEVERGEDALESAVCRYGILERLARSAGRLGVKVVAFGFGRGELRAVLEGGRDAITNVVRGVWKAEVSFAPTLRWNLHPRRLAEAVAWAHQAPVDAGASGPLASPWSSHRDLLGYRDAQFFDGHALRERVDTREVHALAGGGELPLARPRLGRTGESLSLLLRLAAAIVGVLPADRRCFRLFVHLARQLGWGTSDLARALMLTGRRIRQLATGREPLVRVALRSLADPRLSRVP
ncbi:MAG: hypothetical protein JRI25_29115 [Deltaproteobacteria bacterium]|nr:hypothetical protein [Deltaproteobacteria bacterium]